MGIDAEMTALADAIRSKSGTSGKLSIAGMTTAVNNIEIVSDIDLTGVTVTADTMLDGVVAVDASGSKVTGNIKTVTASSDGTKVTVPVGFIAKEQSFTITTDDTGGHDTSSVTATADTMLSGVVAIGRNGETIVGNIKTVEPSVTANVFTVKKGFVAEDTELEVPEATVTETETTATVSPGYVPQELSFELGKAGEEIQYGYINAEGLFQQLDLSGDAPVNSGSPVGIFNAGVFATGTDEANYTTDFTPISYSQLTFTSDEAGSTVALTLLKNSNLTQDDFDEIYYRVNDGEWTKYTLDTPIEVGTSNKVQFWNNSVVLNRESLRIDNNAHITGDGVCFKLTGRIGASGNISSMINYAPISPGCYAHLFRDCASLTTAPELPATELAKFCYYQMFYGCSSLTTAPELPATRLADECYLGMFMYCTSLTVASELSATELAKFCYSRMFLGCTSLTTAPELPATKLTLDCYNYMFLGCTSLITAPELPATTLVENCYARMFGNCTNLRNVRIKANGWLEDATYDWLSGVSETGTFYKPSALPEERGISRIPDGWTVVNID